MKRLLSYYFLILIVVIFFAQLKAVCAQSPSPSPQTSPVAPVQAPAAEPDRHIRDGLKGMAEESRTLIGWGLAIIGGSVIAIASTSYVRPPSKKIRLMYLLFIPGWILVGLSARTGESVSRRYGAVMFAQERKRLIEIGNLMNTEFANQINYLEWGITLFCLWLFAYVLWWVFGSWPETKNT